MGVLWRAACGVVITVIILSFLAWSAAPAAAWDRGPVQTFAVLPDSATGPEGIAVSHGAMDCRVKPSNDEEVRRSNWILL